MKKILALRFLVLSTFSSSVLATECGVLDTRSLFLKKGEYAVSLVHPENQRDDSLRKAGISLGKHQLQARLVGQGHVGNTIMSDVSNGPDVKRMVGEIPFSLDVEKNTIYKLVAKKIGSSASNKPEFEVVVKTKNGKR